MDEGYIDKLRLHVFNDKTDKTQKVGYHAMLVRGMKQLLSYIASQNKIYTLARENNLARFIRITYVTPLYP